jgi:hypothetical protein
MIGPTNSAVKGEGKVNFAKPTTYLILDDSTHAGMASRPVPAIAPRQGKAI